MDGLKQSRSPSPLTITPSLIQHWFSTGRDRPTYAHHLAQQLDLTEVELIHQAFQRELLHQTVEWTTAIVFVQAYLTH